MSEFRHPIWTEGEPLLEEDEQNEINQLRRRQISGADLDHDERRRLQELQAKEDVAKDERKAV